MRSLLLVGAACWLCVCCRDPNSAAAPKPTPALTPSEWPSLLPSNFTVPFFESADPADYLDPILTFEKALGSSYVRLVVHNKASFTVCMEARYLEPSQQAISLYDANKVQFWLEMVAEHDEKYVLGFNYAGKYLFIPPNGDVTQLIDFKREYVAASDPAFFDIGMAYYKCSDVSDLDHPWSAKDVRRYYTRKRDKLPTAAN